MQIKIESFLDILGIPDTQFVVPVYQRVYSWTERQATGFLEDVLNAAETRTSHFAGILLFSVDADSWGDYGRLRIIDGQQRLTTITLILIALARKIEEGALDDLTADEVLKRYLLAGNSTDAPSKLMLSHLDRGTLATLIDNGEMPKEHSERLVENLKIFEDRLEEGDKEIATKLWRGLNQLQVITALLEGEDSPQLVFESLNSKGSPLTASDLVRNTLLFGTDETQRRTLYEARWRPLEQAVCAINGASMDTMIRAWLATRFRDERVRNETDIYTVLRDYLRTSDETLEDMLEDLGKFGAKYTSNDEWRAKVDKFAKDWLEDRPRMSVSQFKMFGS